MNIFTAFAILQWGVILPVQVYFVWRSAKNWKKSDQEVIEAHLQMTKVSQLLTHMMADHGVMHREHSHGDDDGPVIH